MAEENQPGASGGVASLTAALAARFPGRFSAEELERLQTLVQQLDDTARRMRAYPLTNADEPDPIFRAAWLEL